MQVSRRQFSFSLGAFGLAGCSNAVRSRPAQAQTISFKSGDLPKDLRPTPNRAYAAWVQAFKGRARAQGISDQVLRQGFQGTGFLPGVVKRDRNQTEFKKTLEDYLSIAASDERIEKGRAAFSRYRSTLNALEARYGVDAQIIAAIWGLESYFGERRGEIPVVSSTSTLAFDGRRGAFFEKQLIAALKILQSGDVSAKNLKGSWAGAMGHTQFIPTSYQAFAVDFNDDGRRDIWSQDPTDALASTAAYLARNGWKRGLAWGGEQGVFGGRGATIQPQPGGPKFVVTGNFKAIKRYNNSDAYAIGVGHLADRIGGAGALRASFPPDQYGLVKTQRVHLQRRLSALGYDTGGADGVLGPKSQKAIRAFQSQNGMSVTGRPSLELLSVIGN